jgi:hypothetical protein
MSSDPLFAFAEGSLWRQASSSTPSVRGFGLLCVLGHWRAWDFVGHWGLAIGRSAPAGGKPLLTLRAGGVGSRSAGSTPARSPSCARSTPSRSCLVVGALRAYVPACLLRWGLGVEGWRVGCSFLIGPLRLLSLFVSPNPLADAAGARGCPFVARSLRRCPATVLTFPAMV